MRLKQRAIAPPISLTVASAILLGLLSACGGSGPAPSNSGDPNAAPKRGFEVKFLVGSALKDFCAQAATRFNQQRPKLESGKEFHLSCEAAGSGDVVTRTISLAEQLKNGSIQADSPEFPTLISVDGEIYHSQMRYQVEQVFPGQNYIPEITDAPLLANSPMVFMAPADVAPGLSKQTDIFKALVNAANYRDLDASSPQLPIRFVQTAPTRSNSGLQTLVTQFASVSGKRPEELTVADVTQYQGDVQKIQSKVTRYGASTSSLAKDMVKNGPFWASLGSVYESSVIKANSHQQPGQDTYKAIYPQATFTSSMRAILPSGPWVDDREKEAAETVIEFLRSQPIQQVAAEQGLRPGVPGVDLGTKISPQFGVDPAATYDSLRPPAPEVVEAMLKSWQEFAKKPSQVVLVVDTSGSMVVGAKLASVQNTLRTYINGLGPKEQIALIDFDSEIREPVMVDGTPEGRDRGMSFIANLEARGDTRLYDATLAALNWFDDRYKPDTINAVIVLTDGFDSGSQINLPQLTEKLKSSGMATDRRISFFTVGYGADGEFNPDILQQIAEVNGGYYRKGDPESIASLMSDLQVEF